MRELGCRPWQWCDTTQAKDRKKRGEEHGGLSAEFRSNPRHQHIASDLWVVFYPAHLRQILRARSARLLRCGKVQAAGGVDVHRLRDRDVSRHWADFRDPTYPRWRARLRAFAGRWRGGLESHQGQVALEYRRVRILPILGDLLLGRGDVLCRV